WRFQRSRQLRLPFSFSNPLKRPARKAATMPTTKPADADSADAMAFDAPGPYGPLKQFGLVVLCAIWIMLGILGHDPWKTQDAVGFGIALEMIERGNVLETRLAGEPYVDNPPLVYLLAAGTGKALSPPLAL